MKTMLIGFSSKLHYNIALELSKKDFQILYWTCKKKVLDTHVEDDTIFHDTIFHDTFDAVAGIPASGIDISKSEPLTREILVEMSHHESQILAMMTKLDYSKLSVAEKRNKYYEYTKYWYGVLKFLTLDVIIFSDIPHTVYNLILYYLAKLLNIKTVMIKRIGALPDNVIIFEDFYEQKELLVEYKKIKDISSDTSLVSNTIKDFYSSFKKITPNKMPVQYKRFTGMSGKEKATEVFPGVWSIVKSVREFRFVRTVISFLKVLFKKHKLFALEKKSSFGFVLKLKNINYKFIQYRIRKEYERLQMKEVDTDCPFIFLPLHRNPEAAVNPLGGLFSDQLVMIDMIAESLPDGWKLYVKEHPTQWKFPLAHTGRYKGFYKKICAHKNVELLQVDVPSFSLLPHYKAVATITGTAGFEAVMRGKPAIVFGHPQYQDCEGVFRVGDVSSCKDAIHKIKNGYKPDDLRVMQFLQAIENISAKAYIHKRHGVHSDMSFEESVENIANGLYTFCT